MVEVMRRWKGKQAAEKDEAEASIKKVWSSEEEELKEFLKHLKERKEFQLNTSEAIIEEYERIMAESLRRMPKYFSKFPKAKMDILPVEVTLS